jgi:CRISPR/Cas system-associated endonuclease Cas3-HD
MLDSAAVCSALDSPVPSLSAVPRPLCSYIVALHDIGKANPRFQNKDGNRAAALRHLGLILSDKTVRFRHE